jgi:hypothetical protein
MINIVFASYLQPRTIRNVYDAIDRESKWHHDMVVSPICRHTIHIAR